MCFLGVFGWAFGDLNPGYLILGLAGARVKGLNPPLNPKPKGLNPKPT